MGAVPQTNVSTPAPPPAAPGSAWQATASTSGAATPATQAATPAFRAAASGAPTLTDDEKRIARLWMYMKDAHDGALPKFGAQQVLTMALGATLGAGKTISASEMTTFLNANFAGGAFKGTLSLAGLSSFPDQARLRQAIEDAAALFYSLQKRDAFADPKKPLYVTRATSAALAAFMNAVRNDIMGNRATDFLSSRSGDANATTKLQDFSITGVYNGGEIVNGLLSRETLVNDALVRSIVWVGDDMIGEMSAKGHWTKPTLADLGKATLANDFPVYNVVYVRDGVRTSVLADGDLLKQLEAWHASGLITLSTENVDVSMASPGKNPDDWGVKRLYSFEYIQGGVTKQAYSVSEAEFLRLKGLNAQHKITIIPPRVASADAVHLYWDERAIAAYDGLRDPRYAADGAIVAGGDPVARLAQCFNLIYASEASALDQESFKPLGLATRKATRLAPLIKTAALSQKPTMSDKNAIDAMTYKLGIGPGSGFAKIFGEVKGVRNIAQVAGHWAQNWVRHPDHSGGLLGDKSRVDRVMDAVNKALAARGRPTGAADQARRSVKADIDAQRAGVGVAAAAAIFDLAADASAFARLRAVAGSAGVAFESQETLGLLRAVDAGGTLEDGSFLLDEAFSESAALARGNRVFEALNTSTLGATAEVAKFGAAVGQSAAAGAAAAAIGVYLVAGNTRTPITTNFTGAVIVPGTGDIGKATTSPEEGARIIQGVLYGAGTAAAKAAAAANLLAGLTPVKAGLILAALDELQALRPAAQRQLSLDVDRALLRGTSGKAVPIVATHLAATRILTHGAGGQVNVFLDGYAKLSDRAERQVLAIRSDYLADPIKLYAGSSGNPAAGIVADALGRLSADAAATQILRDLKPGLDASGAQAQRYVDAFLNSDPARVGPILQAIARRQASADWGISTAANLIVKTVESTVDAWPPLTHPLAAVLPRTKGDAIKKWFSSVSDPKIFAKISYAAYVAAGRAKTSTRAAPGPGPNPQQVILNALVSVLEDLARESADLAAAAFEFHVETDPILGQLIVNAMEPGLAVPMLFAGGHLEAAVEVLLDSGVGTAAQIVINMILAGNMDGAVALVLALQHFNPEAAAQLVLQVGQAVAHPEGPGFFAAALIEAAEARHADDQVDALILDMADRHEPAIMADVLAELELADGSRHLLQIFAHDAPMAADIAAGMHPAEVALIFAGLVDAGLADDASAMLGQLVATDRASAAAAIIAALIAARNWHAAAVILHYSPHALQAILDAVDQAGHHIIPPGQAALLFQDLDQAHLADWLEELLPPNQTQAPDQTIVDAVVAMSYTSFRALMQYLNEHSALFANLLLWLTRIRPPRPPGSGPRRTLVSVDADAALDKIYMEVSTDTTASKTYRPVAQLPKNLADGAKVFVRFYRNLPGDAHHVLGAVAQVTAGQNTPVQTIDTPEGKIRFYSAATVENGAPTQVFDFKFQRRFDASASLQQGVAAAYIVNNRPVAALPAALYEGDRIAVVFNRSGTAYRSATFAVGAKPVDLYVRGPGNDGFHLTTSASANDAFVIRASYVARDAIATDFSGGVTAQYSLDGGAWGSKPADVAQGRRIRVRFLKDGKRITTAAYDLQFVVGKASGDVWLDGPGNDRYLVRSTVAGGLDTIHATYVARDTIRTDFSSGVTAQYSIDGGAWGSKPADVAQGRQVRVRFFNGGSRVTGKDYDLAFKVGANAARARIVGANGASFDVWSSVAGGADTVHAAHVSMKLAEHVASTALSLDTSYRIAGTKTYLKDLPANLPTGTIVFVRASAFGTPLSPEPHFTVGRDVAYEQNVLGAAGLRYHVRMRTSTAGGVQTVEFDSDRFSTLQLASVVVSRVRGSWVLGAVSKVKDSTLTDAEMVRLRLIIASQPDKSRMPHLADDYFPHVQGMQWTMLTNDDPSGSRITFILSGRVS